MSVRQTVLQTIRWTCSGRRIHQLTPVALQVLLDADADLVVIIRHGAVDVEVGETDFDHLSEMLSRCLLVGEAQLWYGLTRVARIERLMNKGGKFEEGLLGKFV